MYHVRHLGWLIVLAISISASILHAWELSQKPFGFRLQITDDRPTNFFPAAHPILSMNPAGDDFTREPPFAYNILAGLVSENGSFAAGGGVTINSAIALIRLPGDAGTITPLLTRTDVYDSMTRQGQDFDLRTNAATLRYSRHIAANWTLGGAIKLAHNHTALVDSTLKIGSTVTKAEYTLGVLGSPVPNWTTGLFVTQAPSWIDTKITDGGEASIGRKNQGTCFANAIALARRQKTKSLELRATISLCRLWQKTGKAKEAKQMLRKVYSWFTEGFDTPDLKAAKELLDEIS